MGSEMVMSEFRKHSSIYERNGRFEQSKLLTSVHLIMMLAVTTPTTLKMIKNRMELTL